MTTNQIAIHKKNRAHYFIVKYKIILYFKARLANIKKTGAPPPALCATGCLPPSFWEKTGRSLLNPITQWWVRSRWHDAALWLYVISSMFYSELWQSLLPGLRGDGLRSGVHHAFADAPKIQLKWEKKNVNPELEVWVHFPSGEVAFFWRERDLAAGCDMKRLEAWHGATVPPNGHTFPKLNLWFKTHIFWTHRLSQNKLPSLFFFARVTLENKKISHSKRGFLPSTRSLTSHALLFWNSLLLSAGAARLPTPWLYYTHYATCVRLKLESDGLL